MCPKNQFARKVLITKEDHSDCGSGSTPAAILSMKFTDNPFPIVAPPLLKQAFLRYADIVINTMSDKNPEIKNDIKFKDLLTSKLELVMKLICVTFENPEQVVNNEGGLHNLTTIEGEMEIKEDAPKFVKTPFLYDAVMIYLSLNCPKGMNPCDFMKTHSFLNGFTKQINKANNLLNFIFN
jgi:hypothetical protein